MGQRNSRSARKTQEAHAASPQTANDTPQETQPRATSDPIPINKTLGRRGAVCGPEQHAGRQRVQRRPESASPKRKLVHYIEQELDRMRKRNSLCNQVCYTDYLFNYIEEHSPGERAFQYIRRELSFIKNMNKDKNGS
jgi:hypothetical protein